MRSPGCAAVPGSALSRRANSAPSTVREANVEQDRIGLIPTCTCDRPGAGRCLDRSEAGRAKDVSRKLRVLLVVVDDQDERAGLIRHGRDLRCGRMLSAVPIRVVLAEDHYLVREGIRRLLEAEPDIEVAAACGDLEALLDAVESEAPDVVVTDIRMPPGGVDEGIQAALRLRETRPDLGVVVLSTYSDPSVCARAARGRDRRSRIPPQGTPHGRRAARRGDPGRRRRWLGDRPEGR